jgi:hypothetical protein
MSNTIFEIERSSSFTQSGEHQVCLGKWQSLSGRMPCSLARPIEGPRGPDNSSNFPSERETEAQIHPYASVAILPESSQTAKTRAALGTRAYRQGVKMVAAAWTRASEEDRASNWNDRGRSGGFERFQS